MVVSSDSLSQVLNLPKKISLHLSFSLSVIKLSKKTKNPGIVWFVGR